MSPLPYVPIQCPHCGKAVGSEDLSNKRAEDRQAKRRVIAGLFVLVIIIGGTVGGVLILLPRLNLKAPPSLGDFKGHGLPKQPGIPPGIASPLNNFATRLAGAETVLVVTIGCNGSQGISTGSGWPIAPHEIVTAGHVAAGSSSVEVQVPEKAAYVATVVYIDLNQDVAVLYIPGTTFTPLPFSSTDPPALTPVLAMGYPGFNAPEQILPGTTTGVSDINEAGSLTGQPVHAVTAQIVGAAKGMSGGPLVNATGVVIGVVVAGTGASQSASAPSRIHDALVAAATQTAAVDTGRCE